MILLFLTFFIVFGFLIFGFYLLDEFNHFLIIGDFFIFGLLVAFLNFIKFYKCLKKY
ncbi:hypothetical protein QN326_08580 [Candidatus Phytoplasma asteris]|uniref:Uncharacterized protein n=1 Tax=Candidatus Phytoplasma asteris TaxID=85620 RepID=A0ABZ3CDP1_9MOLU